MSLAGRGGRAHGSGAPRLLLDMPGEPPSAALPTVWRCVLPGPRRDRGPEAVLAVAKAPAMAGRTERALVAALARDRLAEPARSTSSSSASARPAATRWARAGH